MHRKTFSSEEYQQKMWNRENVMLEKDVHKSLAWWRRGHGIIYHAGFELLTSIEYCQGLAQFHPNKIGGWIPKLV